METKKQLRFFTIFDYEEEQDYLRKMQQSGWKFRQVNGLGLYRFEKCAPEDVVYQLDYNQDGLAHRAEYLKMFEDCGWEHIQDYFGYSYFRKPVAASGEAEEIFCDEDSRLEMMERVIKGRLLPLLVILFAVLLPAFIWNVRDRQSIPLGIAIIAVWTVYCYVLAKCVVKYRQYRRNARK